MELKIYYCTEWNYRPKAAGLAEDLKKSLDIEIKIVPGNKGIFDVLLDDKLIYSKYKSGRFPDIADILEKIDLDLWGHVLSLSNVD